MDRQQPSRPTVQIVKQTVISRWRVTLPDSIGHLIFWPLAVGGLALDQWTKKAVFDWLEAEQAYRVIDGVVRIVRAQNDGAAFGIASGRHWLLLGVSSVALVLILGFFLFGNTRQRVIQVALGLFAAGVSGNLWDRAFNGGRVRDFIDVVYWPGKHWPTFNVADTLLCIAVGLLLITTFVIGRSDPERAQPQK